MLPYALKEVSFRYCGHDIRLILSQGLFSSHDIDSGSRLLLKTLVPVVKERTVSSLLDCGSGTGTLGIALGKALAADKVRMTDRDAFAVYYSRENARLNNLTCETGTTLLLEEDESQRYDLIVSNIPAKAGNAVIEDFIKRLGGHLSEKGKAAVVIVYTLAEMVKEFIRNAGYTIEYEEATKQHTVYHFAGEKTYQPLDETCYSRQASSFVLGKIPFTLQTSWSLGDFDTAGFHLQLAGNMLEKVSPAGKWLFWNPGQGHLPCYMKEKKGQGPDEIILAGRDILALNTSVRNLGDIPTSSCPAPFFEDLAKKLPLKNFDGIIVVCDPIPKTDWVSPLIETALKLLKKDGRLFAVGKSSDMIHLFKAHKPFRLLEDKKLKGRRGLLLAVKS